MYVWVLDSLMFESNFRTSRRDFCDDFSLSQKIDPFERLNLTSNRMSIEQQKFFIRMSFSQFNIWI